MQDLEKIIYDNREIFDSHEPSKGHFDRFENLLNNQKKSRKLSFKTTAFKISKIAAIIILATISSLWVYEHTFTNEVNSGIALHEVSKEYKEVEFYYTSQINNKYEQIKTIDFKDSTQKTLLLKEISEMDSIYNTLKIDLKANPNDKRIINAMIKHYRTKAAVMNQILNQLQTMTNYTEENKTNNVNI
ncbi:MAG: hypothetical protein U9R54_07575 [Bacteroidota bacterium]|nr:hypothetical protein [Bacteroidota bacterium]